MKKFSFKYLGSMGIARILVSIDPHEGFTKRMTLKNGDISLEQPLDYVILSFRYLMCEEYGHLVDSCSLSFKKEDWVRKNSLSKDVSNEVFGDKRSWVVSSSEKRECRAPIGRKSTCEICQRGFEIGLCKGF
jgi:hypothetical protein